MLPCSLRHISAMQEPRQLPSLRAKLFVGGAAAGTRSMCSNYLGIYGCTTAHMPHQAKSRAPKRAGVRLILGGTRR